MNRILYLLTALVLSVTVYSQNLTPDGANSSVKFKIKNFGFNVGGSFSGLKGTIKFDPNDLGNSSFDVTVASNTVNTDNETRDGHLKKDTYFDVEKYPTIKFVSTKVTHSNKAGTLFITGKLTLKDVTKEISFPFTASPDNGGYVFDGEFTIERKDFHVGGGSTLSNDVTITLHVVGKKS